VITADRGFAGTYNTNVLRVAEQRVRAAAPGAVQLVVVGRRGRDYFRRRALPILAAHTDLPGEASLEFAQRLTGELTELFVGGRWIASISFTPISSTRWCAA
jgi:F-type H+-transporting ATPase subunit gamma